MARRWDEYVVFRDRASGVVGSIRCYGEGTATAIAKMKRDQGFDNVRIIGRPASRRKEPHSVSHGRLPVSLWGCYRN